MTAQLVVILTSHPYAGEVTFTAVEPTTGRDGEHLGTCPNAATDVNALADHITRCCGGALFVARGPFDARDIKRRDGLITYVNNHGFTG